MAGSLYRKQIQKTMKSLRQATALEVFEALSNHTRGPTRRQTAIILHELTCEGVIRSEPYEKGNLYIMEGSE